MGIANEAKGGIAGAFEKLGQKLYTNPTQLAQNVAKSGMKKNMDVVLAYQQSAIGMNKEAQKDITDTLKNILRAESSEAADKIALSKVGADMQEPLSKKINTKRDLIKSAASGKRTDEFLKEVYGETIPGKAIKAFEMGASYFMEDGKKVARIGTAVAGGVGLRVLSGGNLTHNNTGERDIVGVPLI